jgi:hypothetical protein
MGSSKSNSLQAEATFDRIPVGTWSYAVLALLSEGYPPLFGRLPMRYSPVRHCTAPLAEGFSFDLHVLGAPPAFVLSQDQTLHRNLKSQSRLTVLLVELTKKPANPLIHAIELSKSNKEPLAIPRRRASRSSGTLSGNYTTPNRLRNR